MDFIGLKYQKTTTPHRCHGLSRNLFLDFGDFSALSKRAIEFSQTKKLHEWKAHFVTTSFSKSHFICDKCSDKCTFF